MGFCSSVSNFHVLVMSARMPLRYSLIYSVYKSATSRIPSPIPTARSSSVSVTRHSALSTAPAPSVCCLMRTPCIPSGLMIRTGSCGISAVSITSLVSHTSTLSPSRLIVTAATALRMLVRLLPMAMISCDMDQAQRPHPLALVQPAIQIHQVR